MKTIKKIIKLCALIIWVMQIASCTGGGGGTSVTNMQLSGTVSAGAVMDSGTVTVYDATGATAASNVTVNSDGTYNVTFPSNFVAPFTVKAVGNIGAASTTFYALAPSAGTANVNPVTHAMAANLANGGDPSNLTLGHNITSNAINSLDSSFQTALSNVNAATGATGSLLTSTYSSALDATLDNLSVNTSPSGKTTISTTTNQAADDMGVSSSGTNLNASTFSAGTSPADIANLSSNLTATQTSVLKANDLSWLTSQLSNCFATAAQGRFVDSSAATPITACSYSNFTNNNASLDTTFKHSGYYWMDPNFFSHGSTYNGRTVAGNSICGVSGGSSSAVANGNWNNPICRGYFGFLLTSPTYDKATFLTPQIIRPLNTSTGTWLVRFPIQFADGSRDYLGTHVGIDWMVVQKTATPTSADPGWRMVGDQRSWAVNANSSATHIVNALNNGYERWMSSLTFFVTGSLSEIDQTHYIKAAVVTGPGLPNAGINLVNNFSVTGGGTVTSGTTSQCGSLFGGAYLALKLPAYTDSAAPPCSALYKLTFVASTPAYNPDCSKAIAKSTYYYCNNSNVNMSDSMISSAFDGKVGQPYTVVLTLGKLTDQSDDGTLSYIVRLQNPPLLSTDLKSAQLNYLNFTSGTISSLANYSGTGTFSANWTVSKAPRPFKVQFQWNQGNGNFNLASNQQMIDSGSMTVGCSVAGPSFTTPCSNASWFNTINQLPNDNQGGGQFIVWGRFPSNLTVGSVISQF